MYDHVTKIIDICVNVQRGTHMVNIQGEYSNFPFPVSVSSWRVNRSLTHQEQGKCSTSCELNRKC